MSYLLKQQGIKEVVYFNNILLFQFDLLKLKKQCFKVRKLFYFKALVVSKGFEAEISKCYQFKIIHMAKSLNLSNFIKLEVKKASNNP